MKTEYNKLIRDLIPNRMDSKGIRYKLHTATEEEFKLKLEEKLGEEVAEYLKDKNTEELADVLEVVYALGELHGTHPLDLENLRKKKAEERGGFKLKLILEETGE
jgi:predicted house-cleaning noncanonical NTP pyrophosphatase (MazG superfamily)